jgi:hypothetical protein
MGHNLMGCGGRRLFAFLRIAIMKDQASIAEAGHSSRTDQFTNAGKYSSLQRGWVLLVLGGVFLMILMALFGDPEQDDSGQFQPSVVHKPAVPDPPNDRAPDNSGRRVVTVPEAS